MDKRFQAKVDLSLRKLARQWKPIQNVRKRAKIGPELFKCEGCGQIVYSGARSIEVIKIDFPTAIVDKIEIDHIEPVVPTNWDGIRDWNVHFKRLFCDESNLQALCKSGCHLTKTLMENSERTEWKRKLKLEKK